MSSVVRPGKSSTSLTGRSLFIGLNKASISAQVFSVSVMIRFCMSHRYEYTSQFNCWIQQMLVSEETTLTAPGHCSAKYWTTSSDAVFSPSAIYSPQHASQFPQHAKSKGSLPSPVVNWTAPGHCSTKHWTTSSDTMRILHATCKGRFLLESAIFTASGHCSTTHWTTSTVSLVEIAQCKGRLPSAVAIFTASGHCPNKTGPRQVMLSCCCMLHEREENLRCPVVSALQHRATARPGTELIRAILSLDSSMLHPRVAAHTRLFPWRNQAIDRQDTGLLPAMLPHSSMPDVKGDFPSRPSIRWNQAIARPGTGLLPAMVPYSSMPNALGCYRRRLMP
jgi:hypothetical protein